MRGQWFLWPRLRDSVSAASRQWHFNNAVIARRVPRRLLAPAAAWLLMAIAPSILAQPVPDEAPLEIEKVKPGDVTVAFSPRLPPAAAQLRIWLDEAELLRKALPRREPADQYIDCMAATWLFDAYPNELSRTEDRVRQWLADDKVQRLADVVKQRMGPVTEPDPEALNYCWWPHEHMKDHRCDLPEGVTEAAREQQVAGWGADDLPELDQLPDASCVLLPPDQLPHVGKV